MNDSGQYMVQVGGDFDQNTYIIQDANGVPVQYEGGTIIQGDLSDGNTLLNEPRWIQQGAGRGGKILSNQNIFNGDLVSVNGTGLNLNTRFTPSSIVLNSSATGAQFDQDNLRITSAVTGAGSRGRPRGRKPSRGNFPVVPIDMVRQLGIEQQVILQPTVPVAMKNKITMCKPLLMSKKTQCNENDMSAIGINNGTKEPIIKYIHTPVFIPVPVPVYVPIPTFIRTKSSLRENEESVEVIETVNDVLKDESKDDLTLIEATVLCVTETEERALCSPESEAVVELVEEIRSVNESLDIAVANVETIESNADTETVLQTKLQKRQNTDTSESVVTKQTKIECEVADRKDVDNCKLKYSYGINAWRHWSKNMDLLKLSVTDINRHLSEFVQKIRKPNNEVYVPDSILYLCLGIQLFLFEHKYDVNLFVDPRLARFQLELNKILATFKPKLSENQVLVCRIEEEHLWESQQFGLTSPGVLIFSVCYLLTKQMKLKTGLEHRDLNFSQMTVSDSKIVLKSKKNTETVVVNKGPNTKRCFYSMLKKYIEKCSSMDGHCGTGSLYLTPLEKEDSGEWFEATAMDASRLDMMLNRIRIVKEVQESLLSSSL